MTGRPSWLRWTGACGAAEFVGMVAAASAYLLGAALVGEPSTWAAATVTLLIVVAGGVVEGVAVGSVQAWLLSTWLPTFPARGWIGVTVLVAGAGWLLGSMPSLLASLLSDSPGAQASTGAPPTIVMLLGGLGVGLVMGAAFGGAQALVLRHCVRNPAIWVLANSLGWALAMSVMFVGASTPNAEWSAASILVTAALTGVLAGICVGGVTGAFLPRLHPTAVAASLSG